MKVPTRSSGLSLEARSAPPPRSTKKMKLKCIVAVALVAHLNACTINKVPPLAQSNLSAQVLVERLEDNGVLNIRMVDVMIDDHQILSLLGGQVASAYLEPGNHFIRAESPEPYDPNSTNKWKSESICFTISKGETKRFFVSGAGNGSDYTQWEVRQAK
jgi:hypothetical protein